MYFSTNGILFNQLYFQWSVTILWITLTTSFYMATLSIKTRHIFDHTCSTLGGEKKAKKK